jgi:DNA-binding transcriptional LysR family regulator
VTLTPAGAEFLGHARAILEGEARARACVLPAATQAA